MPGTSKCHCPACGTALDASARFCTQCGGKQSAGTGSEPKKSGGKPSRFPFSIFLLFAAILGIGYVSSYYPPPSAGSTSCLPSDGECWYDKHRTELTVHCKPAIAAYAQYDVEWTDSWTNRAFDEFATNSEGTIRVRGTAVKFQNGFGAWQPQRYQCTFNPYNPEATTAVILGRR